MLCNQCVTLPSGFHSFHRVLQWKLSASIGGDLRKGPKISRDSPFKSTAGPGKISLTPIYPEKGFMVPGCRATKPSAPYFYNILYKIVIDKLSYFLHQKVFQVILLKQTGK